MAKAKRPVGRPVKPIKEKKVQVIFYVPMKHQKEMKERGTILMNEICKPVAKTI